MDLLEDSQTTTNRNTLRWLAFIVIVSMIARVGSAIYMGNTVEVLPGIFDQVSYDALARRVLGGYGFSFAHQWWPQTAAGEPTAHWSFLYTLYLTAVYALFGPNPLVARLIQALVVGILQPYLAYLLGRRVFGERAGLFAAAFTAIYIYFVYYAAALMTEPFYIVAILGALYGLLLLRDAPPRQEWRLALIIGLALGSAVLLRQLFLLLIPFLLLWLWVVRFHDSTRKGRAGKVRRPKFADFLRGSRAPWRASLAIVVVVIALILPFTLYNYGRFDRFVLLNTNAGFAFFWGNHPIYGTRFRGILPPEMGSYQDLIPQELRHLDEPALEQALLDRGLQFIVDDPVRFIALSFSRVPVYFMFWPSSESGMLSNISRVGSFGLFLPLMVGGLIYSLANSQVRHRTLTNAALLLLFIVLYTGVHLVSWALVRYRLPVDAILLVYGGLAADVVMIRFASRRGRLVSGQSYS